MIDTERINNQLHVKRQSPLLILGDWQSMQRGSTVNCIWKGNHLFWPWGVELMINAERINSQLCVKRWLPLHVKWWSLCTWNGNCFCMWKGNCLHWSCRGQIKIDIERIYSQFCVKRWSPLCVKRQLMQRGSTVNFHMENSKDLTYFSFMLLLKLYIHHNTQFSLKSCTLICHF